MGNSFRTDVEIHNNTPTPIDTQVSDVDNYDWDGNSRPDHVLQNRTISPGGYIKERLECNAHATSNMYTLYLKRRDGTVARCRIDQGSARANEGDIDFMRENGRPWEEGNVHGAMGRMVGFQIYKAIQHREKYKLECHNGSPNYVTRAERIWRHGIIKITDSRK